MSSALPLFQQSYLDIFHDPTLGWLHADWKGYQTVRSVQTGCEAMLQLMVERQAFRVLNDNSNVIGIWVGAAEWVAQDWFPRMKRAGMQRFAWIYSPTRFSQVSTDTTLALMDADAHCIKVCVDMESAKAWLRQA